MQLTSCSFAHPVVPWQRRAALTLADRALQEAHERLSESGLEAFLLSTCLRIEVAVAGDTASAAAALGSIYGDPGLLAGATVRTDGDAFLYLSRLAAGLESPIVGEREVLAQFRRAVSACGEAAELTHMLQRAVGVARSIRRMSDGPVGSLATLAAARVASFERIAVLGSGAMARAAAAALDGKVTMFARRPDRSGNHLARPWSDLPQAFQAFPAVIAAVPGPGDTADIRGVLQQVGGRTQRLVVIDLGMPPLLAELAGVPGVRFVDIDELAAGADPQPGPEISSAATREAARAWAQLSGDDRISSVIATLIGQADEAVQDEVRRFAHRVAAADDPEPVLRQLAHTVARRILHPPISYISSAPDRRQALDVLERAFGVEP